MDKIAFFFLAAVIAGLIGSVCLGSCSELLEDELRRKEAIAHGVLAAICFTVWGVFCVLMLGGF